MGELRNEHVEYTDSGVVRTCDVVTTRKVTEQIKVEVSIGGQYLTIEDSARGKVTIDAADAEHIGNLLIKKGREAAAKRKLQAA